MAGCALNFRANMRSVIEANMCFIGPSIDALPWNLLSALFVCGHLLNFRLVRRDCLVTYHAIFHARNACHGPLRDAHVTVVTLQFCYFDVRLVLVCDRLNRFASDTEKMTNRFSERPVSGGEYFPRCRRRRGVGLRSHHYASCERGHDYADFPPPQVLINAPHNELVNINE
jgi:hypothetical protein